MGQITSVSDVFGLLRRRIWLILLVLIVGIPAVVMFALNRPQLFEATAVIQIEAPQIATANLAQPVTQSEADGQLDLIQQKLMSRDSLITVLGKFDIFPEEMSLTEQVSLLRQSVAITKLVDPSQAWQPNVQPSGLSITVRMADAQQSADVANEFLAMILNEAQARSQDRATRTLEFFAAEEARVSAEMSAIEADFARFQEENGNSLPDGLVGQRDQQSRLVESRIVLDQQIIVLQTNSDRQRADEVARQKDLLERQRDLIDQNINEIQAALDAAPEVQRQFSAFDRQIEQLQAEFSVITSRRTEAAMNQLLESQDQAARYEVLETAIAPEFSVSASRKKVAVAGAVMTGLIALGMALAVELMNPAIRTAAQLERQLGVQAVIVVPHLTNRRQARYRKMGRIAMLLALLGALFLGLRGRIGAIFDAFPSQNRTAVPVVTGRRRR